MALQFLSVLSIALVGDGVSTRFKFKLSNLPLVNQNMLPLNVVPTSVTEQTIGQGATASLVGGPSLQYDFTTAPASGQEIGLEPGFLYNSQ